MTVLAGRYELREPLGSGGMSRVLAAHDRLLGRRVAVKLLRDDLAADPIVRERLLREARAAASFTHPNAVAVYDVGEEDGRPFIVLELVEGRPLTDIIRERGGLPADEAVGIADGVLAALAAAHARGLVYRDVKPGNILVQDDGEVKLADFGIAKGIAEAAAGLTATGQVVGTPRYLSPEQAAGAPADARSDLYAAGVVCYELLAGAPPFSGQHAVALALAHQREPVPPLAGARPDVPPQLAAAVHRALEKTPADRFASAEEMRRALRQALAAGGTTAVLPAAAAAHSTPGGTTAALGRTSATTAAPVDQVPARDRATRWAWPAVAVAALVLLGIVLLGDLLDDDGATSDTAGVAGDDDAGSDADPVATPSPPEPTATPTPPPGEQLHALVAELSRELADDEERFGDKGEDLQEDLQEVLSEPDRRTQASEARKLMDEIEKWAADDELDADIAASALRALEDFVRVERDADRGEG